MKKNVLIIVLVLAALIIFTTVALADKPIKTDPEGNEIAWESSNSCTKIQSGLLKASDGSEITTGFDVWGYNYQAHMFNGFYCDAYRDAAWCQPWKDVDLIMKWNDAWLSNVDCNGDGLLDRHYGFDSYIGSGAWETNHQKGTYVDDSGQTCNWEYFVKIVAAPADAYVDAPYDNVGNGTYYAADDTEIGPQIWGDFAVIQRVYNDPCAGDHGIEYLSPDHPGLGNW